MLLLTPCKATAVAVAFLFAGLLQPGRAAPAKHENSGTHLTTQQVIAKASRSVVSLSVYGQDGQVFATGSGFVVGKNMIATNLHVVFGAHAVNANFPDGQSESAPDTIAWDAMNDLIILLVNTHGLPALQVAALPAIGDSVIAIGSPRELNNSVSTGIVSGIRMQDGTRVIQTTAPISHGSSGGPLLNDTGRVLGITSSSLTDGQNLNFAVSAGYLAKIIPTTIKHLVSWRDLEENKWWRTEPTQASQTSDDVVNSGDAEVANALGNIYLTQEKYDDAANQFRKAIQIEPDLSVSHYNLGLVLEKQDKLDQALEEYSKASKLDPKASDPHKQLSHLYNDIKLYDKAISEADTALAIDPKDAFTYSQKGWALFETDKFSDAELAYRTALRWNENYAYARVDLGMVLESLNRHDEARQQWQQVLEMNDTDASKAAQALLDKFP